MTTAELERSVRSLIRDAQDRVEVPETNAIAEIVARDLNKEQLHHYAIRGIAESVRVTMSAQRRAQAPTDSARWDDVKDQQESGELDLARYTIWTGEARKGVLDASYMDLMTAAGEHRVTAKGHTTSAARLERLAEVLKRRKRGVVGDLPEGLVRDILDA